MDSREVPQMFWNNRRLLQVLVAAIIELVAIYLKNRASIRRGVLESFLEKNSTVGDGDR